MSGTLKYTVFKTAMGWVGILASEKGVLGTTLPQPTPGEATTALGPAVKLAGKDDGALEDLASRVKGYFDGRQVDFHDVLDMGRYKPFQRRVWEATRRIPRGETRSYLWLAKHVRRARAARAVGQALGKNPFPIIVPCHRVIASDGGLCGFGGGLEMKRRLLEMESGKKPAHGEPPGRPYKRGPVAGG